MDSKAIMDQLRHALQALAENPKFTPASAAYEHAADMVRDACKPHDNGDGTVTLHGVPVTVPAVWLEGGREVVAVRAQKAGEWFASANGDKVQQCSAEESAWMVKCVRVILSAPQPQFEVGKWYRNKAGEICGPLRLVETVCGAGVFADHDRSYNDRGECSWLAGQDKDLQPGALTVWQPPKSLKAGEWVLECDGKLRKTTEPKIAIDTQTASRVFADWTDPPREGRYRIAVDGGVAVWEGEA